jgi:cobyrinic acid a,c-diamide synthase
VVTLPRLVIAAPASGAGKTAVATGLMAALARRGLRVSGHKAGPDYIDPGYHAVATSRPGRNLDPVLCGEDLMAPLLAHGAAGADIAVIEGVMGLFDGVASDGPWGSDPGFGSTAHLAALLGAPVVLVVDAAAAGRSVAALVAGFAGFDPRTRLAGVILNRVGSDRHEDMLRKALAVLPDPVPVLGAIRRHRDVEVPSRHLGLIPAAERQAAAARAVAALGDLAAAGCDLAALIALARSAPPLATSPWDPAAALAALAGPAGPAGHAGSSGYVGPAGLDADTRQASHAGSASHAGPAGLAGLAGHGVLGDPGGRGRPVVALAAGPAFTFGYTEQAELLTAAGAEVVVFDPAIDEKLPDGTAGLLIGGGFPEVYAGELAANEPMRRTVAELAAAGAPVVAECAGLLYLARTLDGQPMCGVLPADAAMTPRLALGYRAATANKDSVITLAGEPVRAHEFHRTAVDHEKKDHEAAWRLPGGAREGVAHGAVLASYLHLHWAGQPAFAGRFAAACAAFRGGTARRRAAPAAAARAGGAR